MVILDQQDTATYPDGNAALWARLFHYIAWRWPERDVVWTAQGPGEFLPPLKPAVLTKVEQWDGSGWIERNPPRTPFGVYLEHGTYRITATVGNATVPAEVQEAYDRLEAYANEMTGDGVTSVKDGDFAMTKSANASGRALQYSGAADLLRAYR